MPEIKLENNYEDKKEDLPCSETNSVPPKGASRVPIFHREPCCMRQSATMDKQTRKRSRPPSPYPEGGAKDEPYKQDVDRYAQKRQEPKKKNELAAVMEENNRLRAHRATTVENERLKAEVSAMSNCNLEKVEEMESLKKKIASLQESLDTGSEEIARLQLSKTTLMTALSGSEQRLHHIHDSWREQVTEIGEKQSTVNSLRYELQKVQEQFQRDTQNLLSERQERKQLQGRLDELRKTYESQGKAAQWHNIIRGSVSMSAIKKDCG